jgi:Spy/CpxP family protein refolding chaperone
MCPDVSGLHQSLAGKRITMLKPIALVVIITALAASLVACTSEEQQAKIFVSVAANKFDLNDQQKAKLFDVAMVALNFRSEMTQDSKELKQELLTMLSADTLDTARINQILDQKEEIFRKYSRLLVADFAELHRTLTAEQKRKLIEMLKKRGAESALRASSEAGCQTGV